MSFSLFISWNFVENWLFLQSSLVMPRLEQAERSNVHRTTRIYSYEIIYSQANNKQ